MNSYLKVLVGIVIVVAGVVLLKTFDFGDTTNVGVESTITSGVYQQDYMLVSTSTATARSDSFEVRGAKRVTFFIGEQFHGGPDTNSTSNEYTFEVGDQQEPGQGTALYSTSTLLSKDFLTLAGNVVFSTSTPFNSTSGGTTTVSLDLDKNSFGFVRVVRVGTADVSTSTVSIIRSY